MKTIDIRSLLLGAVLSVLFLTLTSSKTSSENTGLQIFTRGTIVEVLNTQTSTIYEYHQRGNGKISEKPENTYKIAADGSSIILN